MPHLEIGLARRLGRRRQPRRGGRTSTASRICSSTWRSRARKRRTARQIAEEIEAVGGDLNAATSVETTAYYARVLKADVPLALDVLSDILSEPAFDPEELRREQNVIVQEIGATEDTPDDLVFDRLQETAFPEQPVGRSILGTPETVRSFNAAQAARLSRAQLPRARHGGRRRRRGRSRSRSSPKSERRFASFDGPAAPAPAAGAIRRRHAASRRATSSRCTSRSRCTACRVRDPELFSLQVFTSVLGGGMSSRLFQEVRENARPLLLDLCLPHALFRHRHVRRSMPAPTRPTRRN